MAAGTLSGQCLAAVEAALGPLSSWAFWRQFCTQRSQASQTLEMLPSVCAPPRRQSRQETLSFVVILGAMGPFSVEQASA